MLQQLKNINYHDLPVSDYSRNYILRMLPHIDYYIDIYRHSLQQMLQQTGKEPSNITLVDYGGGHGFLSLTAKEMGIGTVIYIDINPQAAATVTELSKIVGTSPDHILQGDSESLRQWCAENRITPNALLGMDVIEHIYRLEDFFADIYSINPDITMLFTTGSTPYNPWVVRRLHHIMLSDERGHSGQKGFLQLRKEHILQHYPDMSDSEADLWAANTRGLTYPDILTAIDTHTPFKEIDAYNTCDPATGSWTERILPISDYKSLVRPYHATIRVTPGYYNTYRKGLKGIVSRLFNLLLHIPIARPLAPFIFLNIETNDRNKDGVCNKIIM